MGRSRLLLAVAATLYVVAWFLPVIADGTTLANGGLPGWEALRFSFSPLWDSNARDSWWGATLSVMSGLSNTAFLASLVWARGRARVARFLRGSLIVAIAVNLHWFVIADPRSDLRFGYYAWLLSFALLAASLFLPQRPDEDL